MKFEGTMEQKFDLLENILIQSGIARRDFSINGCSDDRVCIEFINNIWTVYLCERGNKCDIYKSADYKSAIKNFVERLTENKKESDEIIYEFLKEEGDI